METSVLSDVRNVYSAQTSSERVLVVVFDSPAATRQILGGPDRLSRPEVVRRGNVTILYTVALNRPSRVEAVRRAVASAFS